MKLFYLQPRRVRPASLRLATLVFILGCLPIACTKKGDAVPQANCKITTIIYQGNGSPETQQTWQYDGNGLLTSIASGGYQTKYTYDANGYLTTATNQTGNGTVSSTTQYEFVSGRLAKSTVKNANGAIVSTTQYEYDTAGELTKYTEQNVGSGTYIATYAGSKQTGYVSRNSSGVESQPYTFENGLVKQYTSGTSQFAYEYDGQRRRVRYETYSNGKLTGYTVYEYVDGMPAQLAQVAYKGISDLIVNGYNQTGLSAGLEAKRTNYAISATNVPTKYSETTTSYTKNTSGFPTESAIVYSEYTATGSVSYTVAYKYAYQYMGCQ